jgi:hypothetical protein
MSPSDVAVGDGVAGAVVAVGGGGIGVLLGRAAGVEVAVASGERTNEAETALSAFMTTVHVSPVAESHPFQETCQPGSATAVRVTVQLSL